MNIEQREQLELVLKALQRDFYHPLGDIAFSGFRAEETLTLKQAAEQFARDSQSKVGKIQTATQGLFSIEAAAPGLEHKKNVRVVTTIVYTLK